MFNEEMITRRVLFVFLELKLDNIETRISEILQIKISTPYFFQLIRNTIYSTTFKVSF